MMRMLSRMLALIPARRSQYALALLAMAYLSAPSGATAQPLPRPDHIVIVVEENHSFGQIIVDAEAPYIKSLVNEGALLTSFFALHHPSQPNYFVLFSGDRQGLVDNTCVQNRPLIVARSLGGQLLRNGLSFHGYAEDLPKTGSTLCHSGKYVRRHAPWISFADVPTLSSRPFTEFPTDFDRLPTLAIVIPNLDHDMHDGASGKKRKNGDNWLRDKLNSYKEWAKTHNSLLIVTWDEDDKTIFFPKRITKPPANRIATIFVGEMVKTGVTSDKQYTHVDLLKTLLEMFGLPQLPTTQNATVITDIWK